MKATESDYNDKYIIMYTLQRLYEYVVKAYFEHNKIHPVIIPKLHSVFSAAYINVRDAEIQNLFSFGTYVNSCWLWFIVL